MGTSFNWMAFDRVVIEVTWAFRRSLVSRMADILFKLMCLGEWEWGGGCYAQRYCQYWEDRAHCCPGAGERQKHFKTHAQDLTQIRRQPDIFVLEQTALCSLPLCHCTISQLIFSCNIFSFLKSVTCSLSFFIL